MTIDTIAGEHSERPPGDWGGYRSQEERNEAIWAACCYEGLSQRTAAKRFGLSHGTIAEIMGDMRRRIPPRDRLDMVAEMTERLSALSEALWPGAMAGDPASHAQLRGHMDRLAKLHGLDAPDRKQVEGSMSLDASPEYLAQVDAARRALAALRPQCTCGLPGGTHLDQCPAG